MPHSITPILPKWKGILTDRDRFNRQMHYQSVDRCFNMEFGYWDENFIEWPLFSENGITNNEEADIFFNFDRMATIGGEVWMHPGFPNEVIEVRETIPHYIKASIVTPEDWEKVKAEKFRLNDPARIIDIAELSKQHPAERDYPLGVWTGSMIGKIRDMLTFEGLAYAMYDYPAMVEDMVETSCQLVENALDQILPHFQFDFASGWEDICYKSGPIVSPKWFHRVITPRYKRISEKLKAHGVGIWWIDCDGDVRPILPFMMEGGVNCLFPYEVNSCTHPADLLHEYGKDLRIMGGFDKIEMGKGRDAIKQYMDTLVPLVERGGYIPFCDHRCPPNIPPDDYLYYLDLKQEYFGLK
jgi:uroporphyrinogen-III decarboxylase